jgi:hypothetical protein
MKFKSIVATRRGGPEVLQIVENDLTRAKIGDRVAALTGHGSYTEMMTLGQEHLVPVPAFVSPAEGFFVTGKQGPLKEDELERAAAWSKGLHP